MFSNITQIMNFTILSLNFTKYIITQVIYIDILNLAKNQ